MTLPAFDQDDLANFFIDCIYQERKSLRHQLLTLRQAEGKTVSTTFNTSLLNIYINTVKTGSQEEIERFSQIEKQKLVQLLATNSELLSYVFDKMFKNNKKAGETTNTKTYSQSDILQAMLETPVD